MSSHNKGYLKVKLLVRCCYIDLLKHCLEKRSVTSAIGSRDVDKDQIYGLLHGYAAFAACKARKYKARLIRVHTSRSAQRQINSSVRARRVCVCDLCYELGRKTNRLVSFFSLRLSKKGY